MAFSQLHFAKLRLIDQSMSINLEKPAPSRRGWRGIVHHRQPQQNQRLPVGVITLEKG